MGLDDARYKEIRSESYSSTEGVENTEKGNSNSIIYLMAAVGIPFTVFIIYALFKQTVIRKRRGLFMLFFVVSILTEPVLFKPFFNVESAPVFSIHKNRKMAPAIIDKGVRASNAPCITLACTTANGECP